MDNDQPDTPVSVAETVEQTQAPTTPDSALSGSEEPAKDVDFFKQLESLLDKLVPPDKVTVEAVDGTVIDLPGAIPARAQIKVFRLMRDLLELDEVAAAIGALQGSTTTTGLVDAIVVLATEEAVANKLGAIFETAYPDKLDGRDPLDLLPLEELVVALLPFSQRFLKRVGTGITSLAKGANDLGV